MGWFSWRPYPCLISNPCSGVWCLLNKSLQIFSCGETNISFPFLPHVPGNIWPKFFVELFWRMLTLRYSSPGKLLPQLLKFIEVTGYWKQNSLEKHKSHSEESNMSLIMEYYLYLKFLKKIRRVFFIKKILVLRRKGRLVPQKVFYYLS